jgi:hypothetical protein
MTANLPSLLQRFFTERLIKLMNVRVSRTSRHISSLYECNPGIADTTTLTPAEIPTAAASK